MYLIKYQGFFGFIKPWTAVRDELTYSQQFLTPSIVMGIEKKLFPELLTEVNYEPRIIRHRLQYSGMNQQQEQTQPKEITIKRRQGIAQRLRSILRRGVMLYPKLFLAFQNETDAVRASTQHICLCRNEDLMFPVGEIQYLTNEEFDKIEGFELHFDQTKEAFLVGYNRFKQNEPMYGWLEMAGNPARVEQYG